MNDPLTLGQYIIQQENEKLLTYIDGVIMQTYADPKWTKPVNNKWFQPTCEFSAEITYVPKIDETIPGILFNNFLGIGPKAAASTLGAAIISQQISGPANGQANVIIVIQNTGTQTWTDSNTANPVHLAAPSGWGNQRINLPSNVAPGQQVTFNFNISLPTVAGIYPVNFQMVEELIEWFGPQTSLSIAVQAAPPVPVISNVPIPVPQPGDLTSAAIIITPVTTCDGVVRTITWTTPTTCKVVKVFLWMGFDEGVIADGDVELYRTSDGSTFGTIQYDRYNPNPDGDDNQKQFDYPSGFLLGANDGFTLNYFGRQYNTPIGHNQARVIVWIQG